MTIAELKRALVKVREICAERDYCCGCPFEMDLTDMHICKLSPRMNSDTVPEIWDVDDWKEDAQHATQGTDQAE